MKDLYSWLDNEAGLSGKENALSPELFLFLVLTRLNSRAIIQDVEGRSPPDGPGPAGMRKGVSRNARLVLQPLPESANCSVDRDTVGISCMRG